MGTIAKETKKSKGNPVKKTKKSKASATKDTKTFEYSAKNHIMVPNHTKLNVQEKKELLEQYKINLNNLSKIRFSDPAIAHLKVKEGDIIKVVRDSATVTTATYYRGVIHD